MNIQSFLEDAKMDSNLRVNHLKKFKDLKPLTLRVCGPKVIILKNSEDPGKQ
jgi:hypothetical protein